MPFFSVVIPVYNKENFVHKTIQSVLSQTFKDFEVIIINDGSTDSSEEKVLQFQDSRIQYYTQKNAGVSVARNFGIKVAQSDYITFIDADDYWYPTFLETMYNTIHKYPEQSVFAGAIEIETEKKIFPAKYSIKKTGDCEIVIYFKASSKVTAICTSSAVFHKNVFKKVGDFDTEIRSGQDTDLWIRIGLEYPVLFVWKIMARYVYDPKSLSKNKKHSTTKINFSKFTSLEKTNPELKSFLDLNRFSLAIKCKLEGNPVLFKSYADDIDLKRLSLRKRVILLMPGFILNQLISLKTILTRYGLASSVFK